MPVRMKRRLWNSFTKTISQGERMKYVEQYIQVLIGAWIMVSGSIPFQEDSILFLLLGAVFIGAAQYRYRKMKKEESNE